VTRPALDVHSFGIDPAYPHAGSIRVQPSLQAILGVIFGLFLIWLVLVIIGVFNSDSNSY
jgi:hypothetical protein